MQPVMRRDLAVLVATPPRIDVSLRKLDSARPVALARARCHAPAHS